MLGSKDEPHRSRDRIVLRGAVFFLFSLGIVLRLAPLADPGGRLLSQFTSEDGYLMLTMARNIALGNGMSTAGGAISSNGTQPLTTYVWAGAFFAAGGDRTGGLILVHVAECAIAVGASAMVWLAGRRLLDHGPLRDGPSIASAVWFASPLCVVHTMNGLETGLTVLLLLTSFYFYLAMTSRPAGFWHFVGLGSVLGATFLARMDSCFFIAALCLAHLFRGGFKWDEISRRCAECVVMGLTSIAVASPWLLYSYVDFGSLMPISGQAESMDAVLGGNIRLVPAALLEYVLVVAQVPSQWETRWPVVLVAASVVVALLAYAPWVLRRSSPIVRTAALVGGMYGLMLVVFYGVFFGAGYFMSRYLFPLSPVLALALVAGWFSLRGLPGGRWLRMGAAFAAMLVLIGLNGRIYRQGLQHEHMQVVSWVEAFVPEEVWVGAIQSGTVGFFHDRTINLDGKVNPAALNARWSRTVPEYVAESEIEVLADWVGITGWMAYPAIGACFDVVVKDRERNLGVLVRQGAGLGKGLHKS